MRKMVRQRLYINVDHVATVRQARRSTYPDPVAAAQICERAGADGITVHLREDRRHIQDADVVELARVARTPVNLEMAATAEMTAIALRIGPHQVTLVPERREEVTTEGGLDLFADPARVASTIDALRNNSPSISPPSGNACAAQRWRRPCRTASVIAPRS